MDIQRLRKFKDEPLPDDMQHWVDAALSLIEEAANELDDWYSAALYDATMTGPKFKGWNRSQLDRCRKLYIEGIK